MTKELQSSRYIVISFLVREIGIDIVEAISLMAELEKENQFIPQCIPEKEETIIDALRYFKMI